MRRSEFWAGRAPVGGAAAVLVAPVVLWFYSNLLLLGQWTDGSWLAYCFLIGFPFAVVAMLCFGIPVLVFLAAWHKHGPLALAMGGAVAGGMAYFTMVLVKALTAWDSLSLLFTPKQLSMYGLGAITGAHCGVCYYAVALRTRRPA